MALKGTGTERNPLTTADSLDTRLQIGQLKKSPSSTGFERSQEHASHFLTKYTVTLKPAINSKVFFFGRKNVWNSVTSQHWPDRAIDGSFISNPGQLIFLSVKPWLQFHCEFFSNLLKRQAFDWMFCIMSSLTQLSWFCWADLDEFVQIIAPRCSDHLNWDAPEKRADQCVKPLEYERLNIYICHRQCCWHRTA